MTDNDFRTALHWAVIYQHEETVGFLIELGAKIDVIDSFDMTPLSYACLKGLNVIAKLLLENEANPSIKIKNGATALHFACAGGHANTVQEMLSNGASVLIFLKKFFVKYSPFIHTVVFS